MNGKFQISNNLLAKNIMPIKFKINKEVEHSFISLKYSNSIKIVLGDQRTKNGNVVEGNFQFWFVFLLYFGCKK